jgi:hypothetical protein
MQPSAGPLPRYRHQFRALIGEVLVQSDYLDHPGSYIPLFYRAGITDTANVFPKVSQ